MHVQKDMYRAGLSLLILALCGSIWVYMRHTVSSLIERRTALSSEVALQTRTEKKAEKLAQEMRASKGLSDIISNLARPVDPVAVITTLEKVGVDAGAKARVSNVAEPEKGTVGFGDKVPVYVFSLDLEGSLQQVDTMLHLLELLPFAAVMRTVSVTQIGETAAWEGSVTIEVPRTKTK
jgi:hypothetical protein